MEELVTGNEDPFLEKVREVMPAELPERCRLVVAFSGGPDSTSLLLAVDALFKNRLAITACHVNHSTRGAEADEDEEFCRSLCAGLSVPLIVSRLHSPGRSEAALRELRYEALERACLEADASICLIGHTLDDQIETVLFRLFRGGAPAGLTGIPFRRRTGAVLYLRPLLRIPRAECLGFLARQKITPRQDSTNLELGYTRNFLRHQVIPLVESRFPGFARRVETLRGFLVEDEAVLSSLASRAREALSRTKDRKGNERIRVDELAGLAPAVARRVLAAELDARGVPVSGQRLAELLLLFEDSGGSINLDASWRICRRGEFLVWIGPGVKTAEAPDFCQSLRVPGLTVVNRLDLAVHVVEHEATDPISFPPRDALEALVDLSRVEGELMIRLRRPGDVIHPIGMDFPVRLKKFLHTHDAPVLEKSGTPVVVSDSVEVLWVPGRGLSKKVAVVERPTHRFRINRLAADNVAIC